MAKIKQSWVISLIIICYDSRCSLVVTCTRRTDLQNSGAPWTGFITETIPGPPIALVRALMCQYLHLLHGGETAAATTSQIPWDMVNFSLPQDRDSQWIWMWDLWLSSILELQKTVTSWADICRCNKKRKILYYPDNFKKFCEHFRGQIDGFWVKN